MRDYLARELKGHNILALERFREDTHWMVEYQDLETLDEYRYFLDDEGYRQIMQRQRKKEIHLQICAHVTEGHIVEFAPKRECRRKPRKHRRTSSAAKGVNKRERHLQSC